MRQILEPIYMKKIAFLLLIPGLIISCNHSKKKSDSNDDGKASSEVYDMNYKVLKKIKIGGEGGWDYTAFDTVNRRLFISHGTKVDVLDVDKEKLVGEIPNTEGVHGIAFAYDFNKGYTSNGKDSSVTVFDLKTLKVLRKINVTGSKPDAILYDPDSKKIFTFNGKSNNTTIINAQTDQVIGTIKLDGKPEFAVTNFNGKVIVNLEDKNKIALIDSRKDSFLYNWDLDTNLHEPSGLSFDLTYGVVFIGCGNKKMGMVSLNNGRSRCTIPIGENVDATAFNTVNRMVFASCGDGTLTIARQINQDSCSKPVTVVTQKGARTMAIDEKLDRVYLPVADFGPPESKGPGEKMRPSIIPGTFSIIVVGKK